MNLSPADEKRNEQQFSYFCKKIIKNEALDIFGHRAYLSSHEKSLDALTPAEEKQVSGIPSPAWQFKELIVRSLIVLIQDEPLFAALSKLPENDLYAIVLRFWLKYSDREIAKLLNKPRSTVNWRRKKVLDALRKELEALK